MQNGFGEQCRFGFILPESPMTQIVKKEEGKKQKKTCYEYFFPVCHDPLRNR